MHDMNRIRHLSLALLVLAVASGVRPAASAAPSGLDRLQAQIVRAATAAHGTVGVAVKHLDGRGAVR